MCKTREAIVCAIVAVGLPLLSPRALGQTVDWRVDGDDGSEYGDGSGWGDDAFDNLQNALAEAELLISGGQAELVRLWVAATDDPYRPGPPGDRTASFQLRDKVELYGGFAGNEDDLSERNIYENITVLSGDLEGDDGEEPFTNRIDNSFHVVRTPEYGSITSRIDGFVIEGGEADGRGDDLSNKGAGMLMRCAPIGIINCTFTDNRAGCTDPFEDQTRGYGAALHVRNQAAAGGGSAPQVDVVNCTFLNNNAVHAGEGGAVWAEGFADMVFTNGLMVGNEAKASDTLSGNGGAILNHGNLQLTNCTLADNFAFGPSSVGDGIATYGSSKLIVENCILWRNGGEEGEQIWLGTPCFPESLVVNYSDVQGGLVGYPPECVDFGPGNMDEDPEFRDESNADYRLLQTSPCRDRGFQGHLPQDDYNLDYDDDFGEMIPYDIILSPRISPELLEMGSYEICVADLDDDGDVDTDDLLILLACWDTPCGDVDGDGDTDTADLLYLLGTWGCGDPTNPPVPESIQDCLDLYWGEQEKLEACIEAMIRAGTP